MNAPGQDALHIQDEPYYEPVGDELRLIEARCRGIHPFCITIDREARDYLPHMYGAVDWTLVDDASRLPLKVADTYRRLTC